MMFLFFNVRLQTSMMFLFFDVRLQASTKMFLFFNVRLQASSALEVVHAFLGAESVVFSSNSWRLQEDMMRNMSSLGKICSQELLYTRIIPVLLAKMKHGVSTRARHWLSNTSSTLAISQQCVCKQEQRKQEQKFIAIKGTYDGQRRTFFIYPCFSKYFMAFC
jgi:hypothetical protein